MITLGLLVAGLVGTIIGGVMKASNTNKQIKEIEKQKEEVTKWHKQSRNQELLDASDLRSSLDLVRKLKSQETEALNNEMIRNNATTEQKIAQASKINQEFGDKLAKVATGDAQYKQEIEDQYMRLINDLNKNTNTAYEKRTQIITNTIDGTIDHIRDASKIVGRL